VRGPLDDAIVAAEQGAAVLEAEEGEAERRPPGGKPLLRLLDLLGPKGLDGAVELAIEAAVGPGEDRGAIDERLESMGVTPPPAKPAPKSRKKSAAAEPGEAAGAMAPEMAEAFAAAAQQLGQPTATGPQWRSLGPWTIPNGQTYGASRVNVSGRVSSIAVDPGNAAHVLCGAAGGGVWESFNRGASWAPRTDYAATCTVGALAFDPNNRLNVYCGTGEGNWWSWLGQGVLRSTNGGTAWSTLCTAPFVGQGFYDLAVDHRNSSRLVAGTTGGLYVSADGGVTWTRRRSQRCWSISIGRGATAEWLAACSDGVFRSTDNGTTWTAVALPGAPGSWNRLAVAIASSNSTVAYAWGSSGGVARLYRRASGTWTAVAAPPGVATGQAWYD
jgi:hypothetical protein